MRNALVAALSGCAEPPCRSGIRRFLDGLSSDELQFLAEFYGTCIVVSGGCIRQAQFEVEAWLASRPSRRPSPDRDHKIILLHEYLSRAGAKPMAAAHAGGA